jgi:hypothetical protein
LPGSEDVEEVGRVVQGTRVVKKQAVPIDRLEKRHGALDDAVGSDVARQCGVVEFVLDARWEAQGAMMATSVA